MLSMAFSQLRRHPGRLIAVLLAVMISVGYLTATLTFVATETGSISSQVTARTAGADVIVESDEVDAEKLAAMLPEVRQASGVETAEVSYQSYLMVDDRTPVELQSLPDHDRLRWAELVDGAWPSNDQQIVLGRSTAEQLNVGLGDQVAITVREEPETFTISGLTDEQKSLFSGMSLTGFVRSTALDPQLAEASLLVIGDGSVSPEQLADRIDTAIGAEATALTARAYADEQLQNLANGADVTQSLLLVFGAVAVLVGAILIVNTFLILLAQRRRQIGLQRAVGVSGSQVRRSILIEALLTGVFGSVLGLGLGIGVAAVAAAVSGSLGSGLVAPPTTLLAGLLGVVVTLLAAVMPARRATRISPLEALRPVDDAATVRRGSVAGGLISAVLAVAGAGLIVLGLRGGSQPLLFSIVGSGLVAVAVLTAARLYVPLLLRAIGLLAQPLGPIGRLATANSARNPGRAAATGAALMLATGLIVTLQVGSSSIKTSVNASLDEQYPVDMIASTSDQLPDTVADRVAAIDGVRQTAVLDAATVKIKPADQPKLEMTVYAGADAPAVINSGSIPDDRLLINPFLAEQIGLRSGDEVRIGTGTEAMPMIIEVSRIADGSDGVMSPSTLASITSKTEPRAVWAKADPGADITEINSSLNQLVDDHPEIWLSGSLTMKATYQTLLDTLLIISTVLLGVAVLIALIGVGNTLGLSVIERSRESALLRALGLQRRQLRLMLATEAVLLAVAGAAVGIAAGALFGWIGSAAMAAELKLGVAHFSMSAGQTAAVAGVAVVAGVLASVLPGRRAARATPVEALAET